MIGLLLTSHGDLGGALLTTATEIVGTFPATEFLAIDRRARITEIRDQVVRSVRRIDEGRGVLVLADMFGGTAANVALELVGSLPIEVVTGVNLPMLLKASTARATATDLASFAQLLKFYGQKNVVVASEILKEREQG